MVNDNGFTFKDTQSVAVLDECPHYYFCPSSLKYHCWRSSSLIFLDQVCETSPLQRGQCEKKNENHQGVPQPCLERDPQNVRLLNVSQLKVLSHFWPCDTYI